jgi:hypothetical protein
MCGERDLGKDDEQICSAASRVVVNLSVKFDGIEEL